MTLVLALGLGIVPSHAGAETSQQAIANLNVLRQANGIPGNLSEDTALSAGCAAHDAYMALNVGDPDTNPHSETPGKPGYSDAGNAAAMSSDLIAYQGAKDAGDLWGPSAMPWMGSFDYGPIHFAQLLAPSATSAWYADDGESYCMGTNLFAYYGAEPPPASPVAPQFFSVPGDGTSWVPYEAIDFESPTSPEALAGLSGVTGPDLLFYAMTPSDSQPTITSATLTGPSGGVPVSVVNGTASVTYFTGQVLPLSSFNPGAAYVIPTSPLTPNATYTATLEWSVNGSSDQQVVTFTTSSSALPSNYFATPTGPSSPAVTEVTVERWPDLQAGTITDSHGQTCGLGEYCHLQEPANSMVSFSAHPAPGYTFQGWSGPCSGTGACTVALGTDGADLTATFVKTSTVKSTGTGTSKTGVGTHKNISRATKPLILHLVTARGTVSAFLRGRHLTCKLARRDGRRWTTERTGRCGSHLIYRHLTAGRYRLTIVSRARSTTRVFTLHHGFVKSRRKTPGGSARRG